MKRNTTLVVIFAIVSMILVTSCSKKQKNPVSPTTQPPIQTEIRSGRLIVVQNSTLQPEDLKVVTFAGSAGLQQNGNFSVEAPKAEKYQLILFICKTSGNPVYLGLYDPSTNTVLANDTSTALALTLINPYLFYTDQTQRKEYLQAVTQNSKFSQLLSLLRDAYQADANTALDYDTHPTIYQLAVQLMKETMENLGGKGGSQSPSVSFAEAPHIEDAPGDLIKFVNPTCVWYAAGVYPNAGSLKDVVSVSRKQKVSYLQWGWPPVVIAPPETTEYKLGDGYFKIYITKGGDFNKISQWNDPVGRATILNTGQAIIYIVELLVGNLPMPKFEDLYRHLHISGNQAAELSLAINKGDAEKFLTTMCEVIVDNKEEIALWIWEDTQAEGAHEFLSIAANLLKNVTLVFKLLGYAEEQAPFIWDLLWAPKDTTYFITQQNGTIINPTQQIDNNVVHIHFNHDEGRIDTLIFKLGSNRDLLDQYWDNANHCGLGRIRGETGTSLTNYSINSDSAIIEYQNASYGTKRFKLSWSTAKGFEMEMVFNLSVASSVDEGATWEPGGDNDGNDYIKVRKADGTEATFHYTYPGPSTGIWDGQALGTGTWDADYDEVFGYKYSFAIRTTFSNGLSADGPFHYLSSGMNTLNFAVKKANDFWIWLGT